MRIRQYHSELWLPRSREEVFAFFAEARNLDSMTPVWLRFRTTTEGAIEMRAGTVIDYRLRIHGVPVRWRTLIREWEPPGRFVDEQVRGPYRLWVHEHTFEERNGGTLVRDQVRYSVPLDFLVHQLLVRPDVERIFACRTKQLLARFGTTAGEA